ncbi:hypothetical protein Cni_G12280 [Canna indica]|uniref:Uncharacterized protein n=1 Tax=Canna indica TaxID=4628 RepID=A0AAQ3K9G9_9LILI|nr:hypothetical protein Cni_G12280 [Canna indica]
MHLASFPGILDELNDLGRGGSPHDRVIDDDDAFSLEDAQDWGELELHGEVALFLVWLDERAAHVVGPNKPLLEGHAGGLREAERCEESGIRDRNHDVGPQSRGLTGERSAEVVAGGVDGVAEDDGVGEAEVDVLKDTAFAGPLRQEAGGGDGVVVAIDDNHLPGVHLAHVLCADEVEGAGLGGEDDGAVGAAAHDEGAEAVGVADGDELVAGEEDEGVGALEALADLDDSGEEGAGGGGADEVEDDLRVGAGAKDGTIRLKVVSERVVVDEVPVVGDSEPAEAVAGDQGLDVGEGGGGAGGGVAVMAYGGGADESLELGSIREDLGDEAEAGARVQVGAIRGDDAGAFLPTVLQSVQTQVAQFRGLRVADYAEDAALLSRLVAEIEQVVIRRSRNGGGGKGGTGGRKDAASDDEGLT